MRRGGFFFDFVFVFGTQRRHKAIKRHSKRQQAALDFYMAKSRSRSRKPKAMAESSSSNNNGRLRRDLVGFKYAEVNEFLFIFVGFFSFLFIYLFRFLFHFTVLDFALSVSVSPCLSRVESSAKNYYQIELTKIIWPICGSV